MARTSGTHARQDVAEGHAAQNHHPRADARNSPLGSDRNAAAPERAQGRFPRFSFQSGIGGIRFMRLARLNLTLGLFAVALTVSAASTSEVADAAMNGNKTALRAALQRKADVNARQSDGTTALHWAVRADDLESTNLLIRAGASVTSANRDG